MRHISGSSQEVHTLWAPLHKIPLSRYELGENVVCKQETLEWKISFAQVLSKSEERGHFNSPPSPPPHFFVFAKGSMRTAVWKLCESWMWSSATTTNSATTSFFWGAVWKFLSLSKAQVVRVPKVSVKSLCSYRIKWKLTTYLHWPMGWTPAAWPLAQDRLEAVLCNASDTCFMEDKKESVRWWLITLIPALKIAFQYRFRPEY